MEQAPLPFSSHFIDINNLKMHYLDEGEGHPVVLLHGNPTWCYLYRNLISRLKPFYRLIALDHIGCGLSQRTPGRRFTFKERVSHIEEFLSRLGLERFSLILHDWGGPLGTLVALNQREKVASITFLNTLLTDTRHLPRALRWVAQGPLTGVFTKSTKAFLHATLRLGAHNLPRSVRNGFLYPYRRWSERESIEQFVSDIPLHPFHRSFPELFRIDRESKSLLSVPIQMVWGMKDPCFRPKHLSRMLELFPHARVRTIATASHLVLEDAPALAEHEIFTFLSEVVSPASIGDQRFEKVEARGVNIESASAIRLFYEQAQRTPSKVAVVNGNDSFNSDAITYQNLASKVSQFRRGLRDCGLLRDQKVLFLSPLSDTTLALLLAVMAQGACPIIIDPGMGLKKMRRCIVDMEPDGVIGSTKGILLVYALGRALKSVTWRVSTSRSPFVVSGSVPQFFKYSTDKEALDVSSNGDALYAYTSGATGRPKAVAFTHTMLNEQVRILRETCAFDDFSVNMPLLPVFSLFDMAIGVTTVIPPLSSSRPIALKENDIINCINQYQVTHTFGSPPLLLKIGRFVEETSITIPSLKKVVLMGAPVGRETFESLSRVYSSEKLVLSYGATEALPVTMATHVTLSDFEGNSPGNEIFYGTPLGRTLKQTHVRIVPLSKKELDEVMRGPFCPPGEIGEIVVSGNQVSPYYGVNISATKHGKAFFEGKLWHRMGDCGYLDDDGNLFFCGRVKHCIEVGGTSYFSIPVEEIVNRHPWVARSALIKYERTQALGLVIEPVKGAFPSSTYEEQLFVEELLRLTQRFLATKSIRHFFFHRSFPVDPRHNAKVYREQLQEWAIGKASIQGAQMFHSKG
jgi:olefin beta-lactone synthetase